ncbi:MAG: hypothetical protein JF606_19975 [Burkholderiales bacterium]|nr:hypothetical protein [Burkholderiales bacterium]
MTSASPEDRVAWVTELTGHEFDLEDLVHWTSRNAFNVLKASVEDLPDKYHLRLPISLVGMDHKTVIQRAEQVMVALNGLGAILAPNYGGVEFSSSMNTVDGTGQRRDAVMSLQGTTIRTAVGRLNAIANGQAMADSSKGMAAQILAEADGSDAVHDALVLMGRLKPTWSELYVAYELVETNDADPMYSEGWIDRTALALFKRTANSRTALGVHARHGEETKDPPPKPMPYEDALGLVRTLVNRWLAYRAGKK